MSWIKTIPFAEATGRLKQIYRRIKGPGDTIDNIMLAHSLRPHTLEGHMALYKHVLHHGANRVPKWFRETLGVYVSLLNRCDYCIDHHAAGLARLLGDEERCRAILKALESGRMAEAFAPREQAALAYAALLTQAPREVEETQIETLRAAGWDDGEILEINQVCAYFAYANRTVLGLGVTTEGDVLGLSPGDSEDPDNWRHG